MHKILVVDDEASIVTLLKFNLEQNGFEVVIASDGLEAIEQVKKESPDVIVLDLMLPKMDGMDVARTLRLDKIHTPILMLTAKDDELDKVLGLEIGADDYMTNPFSPREVIARVKAVLRRTTSFFDGEQVTDILISGPIKIYLERYEAYLYEELLEFTPKEFELLVHFIRNKNRVLSRDTLLSAVWNYDFAGDTRIVDVHVSHLRDKIKENTRKPKYIKTVRGIGYKF